MKKLAVVSLVALALLFTLAAPSDAWGRHGFHGVRTHVFVGFGPAFWWGPPPYWYYYPPPYYVYSPPPTVVVQPPVYVEQPAPAPPAPPPPPEAYWYYCPSAKAYYPNVQSCPEPWIKVPPRQ